MSDVPTTDQTTGNLLLDEIQYKIDETPSGTWRRFVYTDGRLFEEYVSHRQMFGLPLLHYTRGKCPETGKRVVAKGVIAIGRLAIGIVAIGQASAGVVAIGQLGVGLLFGFGQAATGIVAVGQLAIAVGLGLGQIVIGHVAIGQIALGKYVLAQVGFGEHVWDSRGATNTAKWFFQRLIP